MAMVTTNSPGRYLGQNSRSTQSEYLYRRTATYELATLKRVSEGWGMAAGEAWQLAHHMA
jgi:hypothetical protein